MVEQIKFYEEKKRIYRVPKQLHSFQGGSCTAELSIHLSFICTSKRSNVAGPSTRKLIGSAHELPVKYQATDNSVHHSVVQAAVTAAVVATLSILKSRNSSQVVAVAVVLVVVAAVVTSCCRIHLGS
jgi:hypothetical protein